MRTSKCDTHYFKGDHKAPISNVMVLGFTGKLTRHNHALSTHKLADPKNQFGNWEVVCLPNTIGFCNLLQLFSVVWFYRFTQVRLVFCEVTHKIATRKPIFGQNMPEFSNNSWQTWEQWETETQWETMRATERQWETMKNMDKIGVSVYWCFFQICVFENYQWLTHVRSFHFVMPA